MPSLYARLKSAGFERRFVAKHVLPEWWDDRLAVNPANLALAELAIGRMLGFSIAELRDTSLALSARPTARFQLKRRQGTSASSLQPALVVAEFAAGAIASSLAAVPPFQGLMGAAHARSEVLRHARAVDLQSVLNFAWSNGIVVMRLGPLPGSRRPTGVALFRRERPVVQLAARQDSPSWLLFHLAHELGHVLCGHVTPGDPALVDGSLDGTSTDVYEKEADGFAFELLCGKPALGLRFPPSLAAGALAQQVHQAARGLHADPGFLALAHGRQSGRMPVAQLALKHLGLDTGGHALVDGALRRHLRPELPEIVERVVALATA